MKATLEADMNRIDRRGFSSARRGRAGCRRLGAGLTIGALLVSILCFHTPAPANAEPLAPLVRGWEQFFTIDWQVSERGHRPVMTGQVINAWGVAATRVQLLVEGLDATSGVVSQAVMWLGDPVPPGSRVYFELPLSAPAAHYRVSIFAFDWLETASIQAP
jgi:hypothetical protein